MFAHVFNVRATLAQVWATFFMFGQFQLKFAQLFLLSLNLPISKIIHLQFLYYNYQEITTDHFKFLMLTIFCVKSDIIGVTS